MPRSAPTTHARDANRDLSKHALAAALAAVVIWALVPVGTRFFVQRVDPYMFNAIRFIASGCAALPLCVKARPWRWPAQDRWLLLACAVLAVPGYNVPVALGARTLPAGALGVVIATEPVMIAALTVLWQRRAIQPAVILGGVVAFLGVMLTSGVLNGMPRLNLWSTAQVLSGALCWSCYTVLATRLNRHYGSFGVTGAIVVVGSMVLIAVTAPFLNAAMLPDPATTAILGAMGVTSSLLGFLLWNYAGAVLPTERLGLFLYLIPVVSILAGAEFLAETLTFGMLSGGALVICGVWVASRRRLAAAVTESAAR